LADFTSEVLRAPMAEFLGATVFVILGLGSTCQAVLSANRAVASTPSGVTSFLLYVNISIHPGHGRHPCLRILVGLSVGTHSLTDR